MSQVWDIDLISPTGTSPSADIQRIIDGFNTLRSVFSGTVEPVSADRVAYMLWADTTAGRLKMRNAANTAWIPMGELSVANLGHLGSFSQTKTGAYAVVATDRGSLISCTGTFTLTYTAAATLGDGWTNIVRNDGTGVITLDANSAELIDEQLTITLGAGETAIVYCTGTALKTFNRIPLGAQTVNPIINGSMDIWQRGTTFAITHAVPFYTADRWYANLIQAGATYTVNRSTNIPTVAQAGILFNYSIEVDVGVAMTAPAIGDYAYLRQIIEGYNWRAFAQRDIVISFWVMSAKTGIHVLAISNGVDRTYPAQYTVTTANTWENKKVAIPASPSAGTWGFTNARGLDVLFVMASGSTNHGTANTWNSDTKFATASQVNAMDNTVNFFRITGVKMELGSVATPIQFVPFEEELARCKRYYQKSFNYTVAPVQNVGSNFGEYGFIAGKAGVVTNNSNSFPFTPIMRATPSLTIYNPAAANAFVRDTIAGTNCSASTAFPMGEASFIVQVTTPVGTAVGNLLTFNWASDAEL